MKAHWATPFGSWVRMRRAPRIALLLGVSETAVYNWVTGRRNPSLLYRDAMVAMSGGALSHDDIDAQARIAERKRVPRES